MDNPRERLQLARSLRVFGVLSLCFLHLNPGGGYAIGDSSSQNVIMVSCPQDVPDPAALCDALIDAITETTPNTDIRQSDAASDAALKNGDIALTLRLSHISETGIGGHLEWRTAKNSELNVGPTVDFNVMDKTMSAIFYPKFAQGLLKSSPDLFTR